MKILLLLSLLIIKSNVVNVQIEPKMVQVLGGTFIMGNNESTSNAEKPEHKVTISTFWIGKYEITQSEWTAIMYSNPSTNKNCDDCPVEDVTWNEIQQYIERLNSATGKRYRLPTEAEWEYAARGGANTKERYNFSGGNNLDELGWYSANSNGKTHIVGEKKPNELGLYDMSGNVTEWCFDVMNDDFYKVSPVVDPSYDEPGRRYQGRILRGGNCINSALFCTISSKGAASQSEKGNYFRHAGFRLVILK